MEQGPNKNSRNSLTELYDGVYLKNSEHFGEPEELVLHAMALLPSGARVVEFGAGQGRNALPLAQGGFSVKAIDISQVGVDAMNRRAQEGALQNFKAEVGDARIQLAEQYDLILSIFMLQHLSKEEGTAFIKQVQNHTSIGGLNALIVFTADGEFAKGHGGNMQFYPVKEEMKNIYLDAGWEIIEYEEKPVEARATHSDGTPMINVRAQILARKIN